MKRWRRKTRLRIERERQQRKQQAAIERAEANAVLDGLSADDGQQTFIGFDEATDHCRFCRKPLRRGDYCSFYCAAEARIPSMRERDWPCWPGRRQRIPLRTILRSIRNYARYVDVNNWARWSRRRKRLKKAPWQNR